MKYVIAALFLFLFPFTVFSYTDDSHYEILLYEDGTAGIEKISKKDKP